MLYYVFYCGKYRGSVLLMQLQNIKKNLLDSFEKLTFRTYITELQAYQSAFSFILTVDSSSLKYVGGL